MGRPHPRSFRGGPLVDVIERSHDVAALTSIDDILSADPAGVYPRMTAETRAQYRDTVVRLAARWRVSASAIAQGALALAAREPVAPRIEERLQSHVGFYLLDAGAAALHASIGAAGRPPRVWSDRRRMTVFLPALAALNVALTLAIGRPFGPPPAWGLAATIGFWLLFLVLTAQASFDLLFALVLSAVGPRRLPRIDLSAGVTRDHATVLVVPVVLIDRQQLADLQALLLDLYQTIRDPDVPIALVSNFEDSNSAQPTAVQQALLDEAAATIERLNETPGLDRVRPFFLLHRDLQFCATQGQWVGRARKRGKVEDLVVLIATGENPFTRVVGDVRRLLPAKYVLTLDEDTHVCPGALHMLVGAAAHPLNHASVDERRAVVRGHGILTPTIVEVRARPDVDALVGRARAARNAMQDAIGRTGYGGKGLLDVAAYFRVLPGALPDDRVLHQDAVEAMFMKPGAVPEAVFWESRPTTIEGYYRRRHRWIRGAWQNAFVLARRDRPPTLTLFSGWQLVSGAVSPCFPIAATVALVLGSLLNPLALLLTIPFVAAAGVVTIVWQAAALARAKRFGEARSSLMQLAMVPRMVLMGLPDLAHNALVAADAIARTVARLFTGRRLLEWESSAKGQRTDRARRTLGLCRRYWVVEAVCGPIAVVLAAMLQLSWTLVALLVLWSVRPIWLLVRT